MGGGTLRQDSKGEERPEDGISSRVRRTQEVPRTDEVPCHGRGESTVDRRVGSSRRAKRNEELIRRSHDDSDSGVKEVKGTRVGTTTRGDLSLSPEDGDSRRGVSWTIRLLLPRRTPRRKRCQSWSRTLRSVRPLLPNFGSPHVCLEGDPHEIS